jgi:hypothetical protein
MALTGSDITEYINKQNLSCLNQDAGHPVENLLQPNEDLFLSSDENTDHQLLIRLEFMQPVKISGLLLRGKDGETRPAKVKLFTNKLSMDFSEAEEAEPLQEIQFEENCKDPVPLRFVKFQNLTSLQIFVEDNGGGDVTQITRLQVVGGTGDHMDMKAFKPCKG